MESTDIYTLDAILKLLCPHCSSPPLHEQKCFGEEGDPTTQTQGPNTSLWALSLTSRHISAIATPHLYHRPSTTRWGPLLRTLIARPDLGRCVRYLPTRQWVPAGINENCVPPEVRTYWVQQFPNHPSNGGVVRLPGNSLAPLAALLCPSLRELDATVDKGEAVPGFSVLPAQPVVLDTLRTIAVSCPVDTEGATLPRMENLFSLAPNLARFVALVAGEFEPVPIYTPGIDGPMIATPPYYRGNRLEDLDRGARRLWAWAREIVEEPGLWDHTVFLIAGRSGLRLDPRGAVPFYDRVDDPWCVRGLAGRSELWTMSLDARCLVPHADPRMQAGFPPSLTGGQRVSRDVLVDLLPSKVCRLRIVLRAVGPGPEDVGRALSRLADVALERFRSLGRVEVAGPGAGALEPWRVRFEGMNIMFLLSAESDIAFHGYISF